MTASGGTDPALMQDHRGQGLVAGKTHRYYYFNIGSSQDDISILVPAGARWFGIEQNAQGLSLEIYTAARGGVETRDSRIPLAANSARAMMPVKPGERINISHSDGSTAIGIFVLILEGDNLPEGTSELSTSDPG